MSLRPDQVRRYARHILLPDVGGVGQARLLAARILVPDASGAAAVALLYIAAAGAGTLVVTDRGRVGEREVGLLYEALDVGRPRVEAVRDRVAALNPDVTVLDHGEADRTLDAGGAHDDPVEALARGAAAAGRLIREIVS